MKAAFLAAIALASSAFASDVPKPIRFPIRHADPWFVKAMLEGRQVSAPEISVILNAAGMNNQQATATGNAMFSGGRWVVNPTDNSLWWFPDRAPSTNGAPGPGTGPGTRGGS